MGTYTIYYFVDENQVPFYVGVTKNLKQRIRHHLYEAYANRRKLPKYYKLKKVLELGIDANNIIVPQEYNLAKLDAINREIALIKELKEKGIKLYNLTEGGEGFGELTEEGRKRLRQSHIGIKCSSETRQKISKARKGIKFSDRHKENLSKAWAGRTVTQETRRKISQSSLGKINIKKYKLTDPDGREYITTNGLSAFCREHNLQPSILCKVMSGTRKHHKGWVAEKVCK